MSLGRTALSLMVLFALGACVAPSDQTSRRQSMSILATPSVQGPVVLQSQYDVQEIAVVVPRSLSVSESNTYLPDADIVWRGDILGDRYSQVEAIFVTAMAQGTSMMTSGPKVKIQIEVTSFHCLTERARYTTGGNHNMRFNLTVLNAETGAVIDGPRPIEADVLAAGGGAALAEDAAGRTQKVVVTERLTQVIRRELSAIVAAPSPDLMVSRAKTPVDEIGLN